MGARGKGKGGGVRVLERRSRSFPRKNKPTAMPRNAGLSFFRGTTFDFRSVRGEKQKKKEEKKRRGKAEKRTAPPEKKKAFRGYVVNRVYLHRKKISPEE